MVGVLHAETAVNIPCSIDTEIEILKSVRGDPIAKFWGEALSGYCIMQPWFPFRQASKQAICSGEHFVFLLRVDVV